MSAASVGAAVAVVVAFGLAAGVAWRLAVATGLRLAHPAVAWVALHATLFGVGAIALAVVDERPNAAAYTAGGAAAFAVGLVASAAVAARRARAAGVPANPSADLAPVRLPVAALLAGLAVALLVPTLVASGLPFLTPDITGSRTEIAGLAVQPLRVALPGLALALVLRARRAAGEARRSAILVAALAIGALAVFELLLASRYLLAELAAVVVLGWLLAGTRVPWRVALTVGAAGIVLFGGIQLVRAWDQASGRPLEFVVDRTVSRVVLVQPRTMDALMRVIPAEEPHFLGLTWLRRLGPVTDREIPNLGYWIYPEAVGRPGATGGYAAPGLLGEAWANFGWAGLVLPGLAGVAAERLGALAARRREGEADVVVVALASLFLARTHALGLLGLGVLWVLVASWRLLAGPVGRLPGDVRRVLAWRA